jgi:hypothetical protein
LASCVVQSAIELPYQAVRYQIADTIDLVLHLGRRDGARVVEELLQVGRYDAPRDGYDSVVLFHSAGAAPDTSEAPEDDRVSGMNRVGPSVASRVDGGAAGIADAVTGG